MKWILVLLFIPSLCFAEINGEFRIGKDLRDDVAFTQIELSYNFDIWQINIMPYGSITSWFFIDWEKIIGGQSPFRVIYEAGLRSTVGIFFVDLNHFCNHAVYASYSRNDWYNMRWSDALTTLSIGIEW